MTTPSPPVTRSDALALIHDALREISAFANITEIRYAGPSSLIQIHHRNGSVLYIDDVAPAAASTQQVTLTLAEAPDAVRMPYLDIILTSLDAEATAAAAVSSPNPLLDALSTWALR